MDMKLTALVQMYLEDQTDGLVQSITSMVDAIRSSEPMTAVHDHITNIASRIGNIANSVERTASEASSYQSLLQDQSHDILSILQNCRHELLQTSGSQSRESMQRLPPLAFQIARETKELVSRIMAIEAGRDEDFS
jgi:gas vesicle protein